MKKAEKIIIAVTGITVLGLLVAWGISAASASPTVAPVAKVNKSEGKIMGIATRSEMNEWLLNYGFSQVELDKMPDMFLYVTYIQAQPSKTTT